MGEDRDLEVDATITGDLLDLKIVGEGYGGVSPDLDIHSIKREGFECLDFFNEAEFEMIEKLIWEQTK